MWFLCTLLVNTLPLAQQQLEQDEAHHKLDPGARMQLMTALALVIVLGLLAIIAIRVTGRLTRWYGRDYRDYRFAPRDKPDMDDWAQKPLMPPLEDSDAEQLGE
jgi:hypothetical protein